LKPGQIIHIKARNEDHYWHIESVCYGGVNQESVIHVGRADGKIKPDCLGKQQAMFVPELMITTLLETGHAKIYEAFENDKHELTA
jgi:hypothetical protein